MNLKNAICKKTKKKQKKRKEMQSLGNTIQKMRNCNRESKKEW